MYLRTGDLAVRLIARFGRAGFVMVPAAICTLTLTGFAPRALGAGTASWPTFGWNVARTSAPTTFMGIDAENLRTMRRQQIKLPGTVDSSAIFLSGIRVKGAIHNVLFVTTTYGKTLAIDARSGTILWQFTPPGYARWAGSYRITTATPVAGPHHRYLYAASPGGTIRKLAVDDGQVIWTTSITKLPQREKIASPLTYFRGRIIATTGGYIGDQPPYQGHVAVLDAHSGQLLHVWNALCSQRSGLIDPPSCSQSGAAIWGRAGAVVDPTTGDIFVATGNARWNGMGNWGDSVIELNADATRMLGNYTPTDTEKLDRDDLDLGSTSPVLLDSSFVLQGGKDGKLRLIYWPLMRGTKAHRGGADIHVPTPGSAPLFSAPAVWKRAASSWIYVADGRGTAAWRLHGHQLHLQWYNHRAGTSPVVVDGLVFVYDPNGGLYVYKALTGKEVADLPCGSGHWNSPVVVDGKIILPTGNANAHRTGGTINIWSIR